MPCRIKPCASKPNAKRLIGVTISSGILNATSAIVGDVWLSHCSNDSRFNHLTKVCPIAVNKSQSHSSKIRMIAKSESRNFFMVALKRVLKQDSHCRRETPSFNQGFHDRRI